MCIQYKEFERQKRVINMMITAHSVLRDKYLCRSKLFDISLLVAAIFLNALVFVSNDFYTNLSMNPENAKLYIGIISVILLALSIVGIMLNTKQKSENHGQACVQLFYLLNEIRNIEDINDPKEKLQHIDLFSSKYAQITAMLVPIPSKKFNRLKSIHLRKIEFSKFISIHKSKPFLIQKFLFIKHSLKNKKHE